MAPPRCRFIKGRTARVGNTEPSTLTRYMSSKASSTTSSKAPDTLVPAQLISTFVCVWGAVCLDRGQRRVCLQDEERQTPYVDASAQLLDGRRQGLR